MQNWNGYYHSFNNHSIFFAFQLWKTLDINKGTLATTRIEGLNFEMKK